jgi:hypothetical protein
MASAMRHPPRVSRSEKFVEKSPRAACAEPHRATGSTPAQPIFSPAASAMERKKQIKELHFPGTTEPNDDAPDARTIPVAIRVAKAVLLVNSIATELCNSTLNLRTEAEEPRVGA